MAEGDSRRYYASPTLLIVLCEGRDERRAEVREVNEPGLCTEERRGEAVKFTLDAIGDLRDGNAVGSSKLVTLGSESPGELKAH